MISSNISKDTRNENLSDSEYLGEDMSVVSSTDGATREVIESKCEVNEITPIVTEINVTQELEIEKIRKKRRNSFPLNPLWFWKFKMLPNLPNTLQMSVILTLWFVSQVDG